MRKMNWPWAFVIVFGTPTLLLGAGILNEIFRGKKAPKPLDMPALRERLLFLLADERETDLIMLIIHNWIRGEQ